MTETSPVFTSRSRPTAGWTQAPEGLDYQSRVAQELDPGPLERPAPVGAAERRELEPQEEEVIRDAEEECKVDQLRGEEEEEDAPAARTSPSSGVWGRGG